MISHRSPATNCEIIALDQSLPPAFARPLSHDHVRTRHLLMQAVQAWLARTPSQHTRKSYHRDVSQFLQFQGIENAQIEALLSVVPAQVSAWRDHLMHCGAANATVRRKLTTLRSLFSYLQIYGYAEANPAHGKFVNAPSVSRDGKTVGLSPADCRRLLEAPSPESPVGIRDRAILAVLAYSACRVGGLVRLHVGDLRTSGEHRVLSILGKGGKERVVPLHLEAVERLADWMRSAGITVIGLATVRNWIDEAGTRHAEPEFHWLVCFGRLAEFTLDRVKKGTPLYVEGRLHTDRWQSKAGETKTTTEVIVDRLVLLSSRSAAAAQPAECGE